MKKYFLAIAFVLSLNSCNFLFNQDYNVIKLKTIPDSANVYMGNKFLGKTPLILKYDNKLSLKDKFNFRIEKDSFEVRNITIEPISIWPLAIYDAVSVVGLLYSLHYNHPYITIFPRAEFLTSINDRIEHYDTLKPKNKFIIGMMALPQPFNYAGANISYTRDLYRLHNSALIYGDLIIDGVGAIYSYSKIPSQSINSENSLSLALGYKLSSFDRETGSIHSNSILIGGGNTVFTKYTKLEFDNVKKERYSEFAPAIYYNYNFYSLVTTSGFGFTIGYNFNYIFTSMNVSFNF
jgi:hypothetical protein